MTFPCWPRLLCKNVGFSMVNTARGAARSDHGREQLARADSFLDAEKSVYPKQKYLLVHLGGNDLLQALFLFPPMLLLFLVDIMVFSLFKPRKFGPVSALGLVATYTKKHLSLLMDDAAQRNYSRIIISHLPICASIPIARALVSIVCLGLVTNNHITSTLTKASRLYNYTAIDDLVHHYRIKYPNITWEVFEEGETVFSLTQVYYNQQYNLT